MKFRSTLSALALSAMAALIAAALIMPPMSDARASEAAARCAGYARLTLLLANAQKAENFSMRRCMDMIGKRQGNF
jgi:hypothetical protein